MSAIAAVIGIVAVAVITPGPNNFIVMNAAARDGVRAAVPAATAVIVGSLALLGLVWAGAGSVVIAQPNLRSALTAIGALYLIYLGSSLIRLSSPGKHTDHDESSSGLPDKFAQVVAFQFVNLKAWLLMLTATTALSADFEPLIALTVLSAIISILSVLGLSLWAVLGSLSAHVFHYPNARRSFDCLMGMLLILSALALLWEQI